MNSITLTSIKDLEAYRAPIGQRWRFQVQYHNPAYIESAAWVPTFIGSDDFETAMGLLQAMRDNPDLWDEKVPDLRIKDHDSRCFFYGRQGQKLSPSVQPT